MDYDKLKTEVAELLAAHPDWTDQQVADSLNAETVTVTHSRFVTFRTLLSELPVEQAMSVIGKIKAAAEANPVLAEILPSLKDTAEGCGIDMANANARAFVDGLVTAEVLTAEEAAAVKGMAETAISRAEELGLGRVALTDVEIAAGHRTLVQHQED